VGDATVGVIRVGAFMPQAFPARCEAVVQAQPALLRAPCAEACQDAVLTGAYQALTRELEAAYARLRAAGAEVLLLDLSDNGGGSEWAEAVARTLSPRALRSAAMGFLRGPHWARQWADLAARLNAFARTAKGAERARLLAWAAEAERGRREVALPLTPDRPRIVRLGTATGLVATYDPDLAAKPYGPYLFSAGQPAYPFRPGAWGGPVVVLVNQRTFSAAEEVAALLQDNRAAVILGERTGGAGCGHTAGGTPTTLPHSRAVLELPDCVRFRADGSNEVNGVVPDVPTGQRGTDAPAFAARLVAARLPEAVAAARRQWAERRP
jgi:C-terminal processing protease CtpA/Prc